MAGRALALMLASSGLISAQQPARKAGAPATGLERAFSEPHTALELRRRLANVDPVHIPLLFRLAAEGSVPAEDGESLSLGEVERQIVRESLATRPRREVVPFLEDLASRPMDCAARLEAQRLLGCVGSADHLKLLARLTLSPQERGSVAPELRTGFVAALGAVVARDAAALAQLPGLFNESPPGLSGSIVEALAHQSAPAATRALANLLGRSPGLDPLLLARLAERGRLYSSADEPVLEAVRRYLRQRDAGLVCAAALACGRLGDDGAVDELVGLTEHPDGRVRASAFVALERITGLALGTQPSRWTAWYREEMRWWDEEADSLLVRIERGRGLDFVRAARSVLEHRLFRERIAEAFAQALQREGSAELRLACRALEQLRSPSAVAALVQCLEGSDPLVREAAWRALRAITGVELPPEADSWAELAG